MNTIAIKKEDKNKWERRAPLVPHDVKKLSSLGIKTVVEDQQNRAFINLEYQNAGAHIVRHVADYPIIMGVKEIPASQILPNKTYLFFSHTIKGQAYNMPMLREIIKQNSTLIDYECIKNKNNQRLVFFGRFAGIAGMIDSLSLLGNQLLLKGIKSPFIKIKPAFKYKELADAKEDVESVAMDIRAGLDNSITPLVVGITGYGQVSRGVQEILDLLPVKELSPNELLEKHDWESSFIYKVVFAEKDMFEPVDPKAIFDLQEYFSCPEKYRAIFEQYMSQLTVLVNGIYWEEKYPRIVTKSFLKKFVQQKNRKIAHVCDISCDINGSIECTEKATESDNPAFVYKPETDEITDGIDGDGLVILAIDNLPAELPRDASQAFSAAIWPFIPEIVRLDKSVNFADIDISTEIKNAVIVYNGELTPKYKYLSNYL